MGLGAEIKHKQAALGAQMQQHRASLEAQIKQRAIENQHQERVAEARWRAMDIEASLANAKLSAQEQIAAGHSELGNVLSEIGASGGWTDPAAKAKFWATAAKYPQLMKDPSFKELTQTFELADSAKLRADLLTQGATNKTELENVRQQGQMERIMERLNATMQLKVFDADAKAGLETTRQEFKLLQDELRHGYRVGELKTRFGGLRELQDDKQAFEGEITNLKHDLGLVAEDNKQDNRADLLLQRLEGMKSLQGNKQALDLEIRKAQHELDIIRDAKKPSRTGDNDRFDLNKSDEIAFRSELASLKSAFDQGVLEAAEFEKQRDATIAKYKARARTAAPAPAPPTGKRVRVKSPDGKIGTIPESQLDEAKKNGYQLVE